MNLHHAPNLMLKENVVFLYLIHMNFLNVQTFIFISYGMLIPEKCDLALKNVSTSPLSHLHFSLISLSSLLGPLIPFFYFAFHVLSLVHPP